MIHNYSQTTAGKGNEIVQHIGYMTDYFQLLAKDVYGNFLTDDELETVIAGSDLWLHSTDVVARLHAHDHEFVYTGDDLSKIDVEVGTEINSDANIEVEKKEVIKSKSRPTKKKASKKTTKKASKKK
jgi:hypothetical protein